MHQQVTQNDHLRVTYVMQTNNSTEEKIASIKIGTPTSPLESPLLEAIKAAQKIAEIYAGKKIFLCLSGGVDSECMLESFVLAQVHITPVLLAFTGGHNEFDLQHARQACRRHGLQWIEKKVNLDHFYGSTDFHKISTATQCRSPMLVVHMWLFSQLDGVPICAWNAPRIVVNQDHKIRLTLPHELYFSYHRYARVFKQPLRPFFFLETPELYYSFFKLNFVQALLRSPSSWQTLYNLDEYYVKCHMYRSAGYHFNDKKYKYTGFERYKIHVAKTYNADEHEYTRRFRTPLETLFPAPHKSFAEIDLKWVFGDAYADAYLTNFASYKPWNSGLAFQMEPAL